MDKTLNVVAEDGSVVQKSLVDMDDGSYAETIVAKTPSAGSDLSGRMRTSDLLTLFDGKIMNAEDAFKWDTKATGTATYTSQAIKMDVTAGQYVIRQAKTFAPYFSGKPQLIESTTFNFQKQAGLIKRAGYFSSSAVAPYDASKDGFWIEADESTYRLIVSNNGTETHNVPWTSWDAYDEISAYDWSKFTVVEFDFLWLGGAGLRVFMIIDGQFKLVHTINDHAGYKDTLIFKSPNQPVRYEIRSTTGAGSMTSVCCQVATEGATVNEQGQGICVYTPSIDCAVASTIYALAAIRKVAGFRNHHVTMAEFGATIISNQVESGLLLLMVDPTYSADLTWTAKSRIEQGIATAGQTITNVGRVLKVIPMTNSGQASQAPNSALRTLTCGIDNAMGQLAIGYIPLTATQNASGYIQALEF